MIKILRTCLFLFCSLSVSAQQVPAHRPKIALVLEGGGALGFAHIGVIQYLEEQHIPIDLVVGTSMGGLVGGLYALGNSPSEIVALTGQIDWDTVLSGRTAFQDLTFRRKEDRIVFANRLEFGLKHRLSLPEGLNSGHQVGLILDRAALAYGDKQQFDDLPIAFRCVATDLTMGKAKVFDQGSIADAMRATMSIPAVFSPVTIDGHLYSDGGAVDNLPVDVAKQAGADIVIAVYLDQGATGAKGYGSLFGVAARNIESMIAANEMHNMAAADVLVNANLQGWTASSFANGPEIIPRGYEAAKQKQRILAGFAVSDPAWSEYLAQRQAKTKHTIPPPHSIEVITNDRHTADTIESDLAVFKDKPLNTPALDRALTRLTGDGTIDSLGYSLKQSRTAPAVLEVEPFVKPYGPPFLNAGILIDGSDPENVTFGIDTRLTVRGIGGYRAEWRTDGLFGGAYGLSSEYYRPLSDRSRFFLAPRAYATDSPFDLYSGSSRIARYRIGREGFGIDGGFEISRRSEIRFGEDLFWMQTRKKIVTDTYPDDSERETSSSIRYRYYGTDNVVVPRKGFEVETNFTYYRRNAPNKSFPQAELRAGYFIPISKPGSLLFTASGGTAFGTNTLDLQLQSFSLGGPLRLGAYGKNELLGSQYFLFQAGYLHKLLSFSPLIGEGLYGVTFVEAGKVYGSTASPFLDSTFPIDGSVAVVARTALGPIFLGGSLGEGGHRKWWFGIGRVF